MLDEVIGDVIWMDDETKPYETVGLAFDTPPLQSIYTRALTFVKAWETDATDSIAALVSDAVTLQVPRYSIDKAGVDELLEYRRSLGTIGMLTVDSVRVSTTCFECYLHEYGVESSQHGLPRMHAGLKLDFSREGREMRLSSMHLDIEYAPTARRNSTLGEVGKELILASEL